nr:MAG TPA: hypothetical protein [Caudoviricetes sp.]
MVVERSRPSFALWFSPHLENYHIASSLNA